MRVVPPGERQTLRGLEATGQDQRRHWKDMSSRMDTELSSVLDRADELMQDLLQEYDKCVGTQSVTFRAQNLFHEVLLKLRSALDMTMVRIWEMHVDPELDHAKRRKVAKHVDFPICETLEQFNQELSEFHIRHIEQDEKELYELILKAQPFSTKRADLARLKDWSNLGKHVRLVRQECDARPATRVTTPQGTIIHSDGVTFHGPHIMGLPVDPATRQLVSAANAQIKQVTYVSFTVEESGTDPVIFCKFLCQSTRKFLEILFERM